MIGKYGGFVTPYGEVWHSDEYYASAMWPLGFDKGGLHAFMESLGIGHIEGADGSRWYADFEVAVRLKMVARGLSKGGATGRTEGVEGVEAWLTQLKATQELFRLGAKEQALGPMAHLLSTKIWEALRGIQSGEQSREEMVEWELMLRRARRRPRK